MIASGVDACQRDCSSWYSLQVPFATPRTTCSNIPWRFYRSHSPKVMEASHRKEIVQEFVKLVFDFNGDLLVDMLRMFVDIVDGEWEF